MNDFETELQALIDKHREFPGADLVAIRDTLLRAMQRIDVDLMNMGPFRRGPETEDI